MAIALSITQSADGETLVAHDDSTGISVTTKVLTVFDSNGDLIDTYNMGASLTQDVPITADGFYSMTLLINSSLTTTKTYLSTRFYDLQALTLEEALNCGCSSSKSLCNDAVKAMMAKDWAETYFIFGQAVNAQRNITAANTLIATSQSCNCS